jgi:hypothetical protein
MTNLLMLGQIVVAIAATTLLWESFKSLNNCSKDSHLFIRIPLILFLPSSLGILLLIVGGTIINWPVALIVVASAFNVTTNRRKRAILPHNPKCI